MSDGGRSAYKHSEPRESVMMIEQQPDNENYIMIVDDDQTLLKFFKIHLNKFFPKVLVVKNAKEAIEGLKTKPLNSCLRISACLASTVYS